MVGSNKVPEINENVERMIELCVKSWWLETLCSKEGYFPSCDELHSCGPVSVSIVVQFFLQFM